MGKIEPIVLTILTQNSIGRVYPPNFVRLKGIARLDEDQIDRAAEVMGISRDEYVLETYRELQERHAMERGTVAGDLVFESSTGDEA